MFIQAGAIAAERAARCRDSATRGEVAQERRVPVRMGVWLGDLVSVLVAVVVAGTGCTSARERPAFLGAHRKGAGQPAE
ncbi:MAG TPA: hypothetical protein VEM76_15380 [Anaeromyxobacteraceae bacterium]|nr:hypothetical protein [Anaeromyxobacteraceae bacterium]